MELKSVITYHFTEVSKQAKGGWTVLGSVVMQSGFKRTGNSTRVFFRPFVSACFLFQYRNASSRLFFRRKKTPTKIISYRTRRQYSNQHPPYNLRPFLAKCRSQTFEELQSPFVIQNWTGKQVSTLVSMLTEVPMSQTFAPKPSAFFPVAQTFAILSQMFDISRAKDLQNPFARPSRNT